MARLTGAPKRCLARSCIRIGTTALPVPYSHGNGLISTDYLTKPEKAGKSIGDAVKKIPALGAKRSDACRI
jgi:hypothetical protein